MKGLLEKISEELQIDKSQWIPTKFGDVAIQQKGKIDRDNTDLTRYVQGGHMNSEDLHLRSWGELKDEYLGPAFIRRFDEGDILYGSRRTYLRKVVIAPFSGITSNTTFVIRANEKNIDKQLLPFIMMSEGFTENSVRNSKGSVNPYINWKDIAKYEFFLPPKDQQAQLAELLWAMNEVIETEKEVLDKTEKSRSFFIKELLTGSIRLGDFDDSWQKYSMDELAKYRRGSFPQPYGSKEWYDDVNGSAFVQVYDIDYDLKLKKDTKSKISDKAKPMSVFVPKGTLIISIQGSIGRVAITQYDAYVDRTILIFQEFLKEIDLKYFTYTLQRIFKIAEKTAPGATIKTITKETLSSFEINLPCFEEQKLIGERLTLLDQALFQIKAKIETSQSLQKSLINQIFL